MVDRREMNLACLCQELADAPTIVGVAKGKTGESR
jgi:hypothetical protein